MRSNTMHRNITVRRLALDFYQFLRAQKVATRILGHQFSRSRKHAEIDITYRCNLSCVNCNRSCTQAPSRSDIRVDTIESFLEESRAAGMKWERIRLLGGEPTLHPRLETIVDMLLTYRLEHRPQLRIVLCTNGFGKRVNDILAGLPEDVVIKSTAKGRRQRLFRPFNLAPMDSRLFKYADFTAGCRIIMDCGLGLTPSGYYPCAIAGGIDRVFGFNMGRLNLPHPTDNMRDQMAVFCRYCGHFGFLWPTRKQAMSPSWKTAYSSCREGSMSKNTL